MIQLSRSIESKIIAIAILLLTICQSAHASESADPIEAYLENREVELKASEYEKARSQISGDLNDDGMDDIAILYTLEGIGGGGNNYSFFLATFLQTPNDLQFT